MISSVDSSDMPLLSPNVAVCVQGQFIRKSWSQGVNGY